MSKNYVTYKLKNVCLIKMYTLQQAVDLNRLIFAKLA